MRTTVTDEATALKTGRRFMGRVLTPVGFKASAKVWVGKTADVTADDAETGGVEIEANTWYPDELLPGETLYAITATGTSRAQII